MTEARVRDLFNIPERVHQGDFVLKLTEGLQRPDETAADYVATPALVDAFDRSLGLISDALKSGQSKATYLHGSFGSGKSHFMAMLSLLLQGHEGAWRISELHSLREKYPYAGKERLLELHCHMIGVGSLEERLFPTYIAAIEKAHPDAALPGLFADEELFDNARSMIDRVGADQFFAEMGGGKKGWGKHGAGWTQQRFEELAGSTDPVEREKLFSALVKAWFPSYTAQGKYIDLDAGLQVLARHAHGLGYSGVVLFLDELILWLAHRASERSWLNRETEKMIKLVEAQASDRAVPIVSFVARQRSLDEMVGSMYTGQDEKILNDLLNHAQGRFDTITLEDKNLPAIVEKRILKTKDEDSRKQLDGAFEQLKRSAGQSWDTLLASDDPEAFRKLYPFSPALVDALVALSNSLQRQRTAIKLLVELLAEHISDLKLGEIVRVGDLYDVLAGGEEPTDGVMRNRFRSAKQLYEYRFLPVLQENHKTDTTERCQRLRPGHPKRLGCSGCAESQCRTDNRLVKTLLIAALVPEVKVLKDLTVSRLFRLNHGTLKVAVPGMEGSLVAGKLRDWAARNLPLHVGSEKDQTVHVRLEGVDIEPILKKYVREDSSGNRQRVLRDLLFDELGIEKVSDTGKEESTNWNKTNRKGRIVFGNVRAIAFENMRCPDEHDFRLVIDYPFDEPGKTPNDDMNAIEAFMDKQGSWTLVWLPHFFSESANRLLGELAILDHIFSSPEIKRQSVSHLGVKDQERALIDMDNQRNTKRNRLVLILEQAYGLKRADDKDLDVDNRVSEHLVLLQRGADAVQPSIAGNLASAKDAFIHALLDRRYPNHPRFSEPLSPQRLARLQAKFEELLSNEGEKRMPAERALAHELSGTLGELGLVRATEGYVHLVEDKTLQTLENKRQAAGVDRPTVDEIRSWIDTGGMMGLQWQAEDLVVRCYAAWAKRSLEQNGKPFEGPANRQLPGYVMLEKPDMPEQTEWSTALNVAGPCFGLALPGRYLSPDNLMRFHALLNKELSDKAASCTATPLLLKQRAGTFKLEGDFDRLVTAQSADALCTALSGQAPATQVRVLAGFKPQTSAAALGRYVGAASKLQALLSEPLVFGVFDQLKTRESELAGAAELLEDAAKAYRQDEVHISLVERLKALAVTGQALLNPSAEAPRKSTPGAKLLKQGSTTARGAAEIEQALARLDSEIRAELETAPAGLELNLKWSLLRKPE